MVVCVKRNFYIWMINYIMSQFYREKCELDMCMYNERDSSVVYNL